MNHTESTHAVQALNKPVIGNTNGYVFYPITLLDSISVTDKYMYDPYQIISLIISSGPLKRA